MGGATTIPVTEILAYCELFKIAQLEERSRIFRYVGEMDSVVLDHYAKQSAKNSSK